MCMRVCVCASYVNREGGREKEGYTEHTTENV